MCILITVATILMAICICWAALRKPDLSSVLVAMIGLEGGLLIFGLENWQNVAFPYAFWGLFLRIVDVYDERKKAAEAKDSKKDGKN